MTEKPHSGRTPDHFTGCLLAVAVGDALSASIEFMNLDQIRRTHGESGLTGYAPVQDHEGDRQLKIMPLTTLPYFIIN